MANSYGEYQLHSTMADMAYDLNIEKMFKEQDLKNVLNMCLNRHRQRERERAMVSYHDVHYNFYD